MSNTNKLKYHSKNYLLKYSNTTSLTKLESKLSSLREGSDFQYIVAGYLFYNKKNENLMKFDLLRKIRKEYEESITSKTKSSPYFKTNQHINNLTNKVKSEQALKSDMSKDIKKWISELNLSIRYIAKVNDIDYSSLYKFIRNDKYSDLSIQKAHKVILYLRRKSRKK